MVASKRRESQKTTDRKFFAITWFCAPNGRLQKAGPTTARPYKTVNRRRKLPESYTVRAISEDGPYKTVARGSHRRPASEGGRYNGLRATSLNMTMSLSL